MSKVHIEVTARAVVERIQRGKGRKKTEEPQAKETNIRGEGKAGIPSSGLCHSVPFASGLLRDIFFFFERPTASYWHTSQTI